MISTLSALDDSLISWKCTKQLSGSKSSTKSEYCTMSSTCSEIIWLCHLFSEIGLRQQEETPLHADNTSAIYIAANPVFHKCTKHIKVGWHLIREAYDDNTITPPHVSSKLQLADIFTKAMSHDRNQYLVHKLLLVNPLASIWGGC